MSVHIHMQRRPESALSITRGRLLMANKAGPFLCASSAARQVALSSRPLQACLACRNLTSLAATSSMDLTPPGVAATFLRGRIMAMPSQRPTNRFHLYPAWFFFFSRFFFPSSSRAAPRYHRGFSKHFCIVGRHQPWTMKRPLAHGPTLASQWRRIFPAWDAYNGTYTST